MVVSVESLSERKRNNNRGREIKGKDASKRHWGKWYLSRSKPLSLNVFPYPNDEPYEIELVRINSPVKVLCWINHFTESKIWFTLKDLRDFMRACKELQKEGLTPKGEENHDSIWGY